ncbi:MULTISPECIES: DUF3137 domain-containing protein [unclassified Campylobacter]|uniref:DUF3137 domain-containing protein n=1 Tax=unclassified Campylobacter TaxID=2593542 RepID=UPI0022E9BB45|nr:MULTISPECIES: DUF3137 domain-containing protein [unclassified Campylobacter]MDA3043398.1 DUF3137 domain-containing protein [Campylobacter sp. JMF_09 ED2]MDA3045151.1 DUF3137 domain-containing protein [Campylobacter sp. JMF_07 ED4]MDA3056944.1 DUF3137 domain-containing protein [Campylobacter sp. VBCF_04 NA7]MDA3058712.1 DUF3137 domain-containing protein [Campylobacter sp. VBCF_05 NA6]MDA3064249.1 DUF3137 domain-containing protein [Campylobacter sp. JMF_11 EL3]
MKAILELIVWLCKAIEFELDIFSIIKNNRPKFDKIWLKEDFGEVLRATRKAHKKCQKLLAMEFCFWLFTCIIGPFSTFYFSEVFPKNSLIFAAIFPVLIFLSCVHFCRAEVFFGDYKEIFKQNFINQIVKDINPNFSYRHAKINITNSGVYRYDYTMKEDFISGEYKGVKFELAEFCKDNTYTSLKGAIFMCEFYKDFKFNLKIENKKIKLFHNGEILDNVEFNDIFTVSATDKIETRYLLSLSFMERLTQIAKNPNFGIVSSAFSENKFYVFMENGKDLFEPYILYTPDFDLAKYYKSEILALLCIIDELNLTLNIYPKNRKFNH